MGEPPMGPQPQPGPPAIPGTPPKPGLAMGEKPVCPGIPAPGKPPPICWAMRFIIMVIIICIICIIGF